MLVGNFSGFGYAKPLNGFQEAAEFATDYIDRIHGVFEEYVDEQRPLPLPLKEFFNNREGVILTIKTAMSIAAPVEVTQPFVENTERVRQAASQFYTLLPKPRLLMIKPSSAKQNPASTGTSWKITKAWRIALALLVLAAAVAVVLTRYNIRSLP